MSKRYSIYIVILSTVLFVANLQAGIVTGTIVDYDSGEPIDRATIRVEGTGRSAVSNEAGEYRIFLQAGSHRLKFSHIAHYSDYAEIDMPIVDSTLNVDIKLRPSMLILKPLRVYDRKYDPAQKIIVEAIRHKEDILNKLNDYSFDAYVKMVISDRDKPDTTDILMIGESRVQYFWEKPDNYKEIIVGRKQTANIAGGDMLLSVGGVINFNDNRIEINEYSLVSPTAEDALDHYNYYLIDTIQIDSQAVFRLEIEPRSESRPLFVGEIWIADSTYNVVGVDVGFNEAFNLPFIDSLRLGQTFAEFEGEYWMPVEQKIRGNADIGFPGIPPLRIDYIASIDKYRFKINFESSFFDEFALEVADSADNIDSVAWRERQSVPLTERELNAYYRIDSTENAPKPIYKKGLAIIPAALAVGFFMPDLFHFNRVEGAYLGLGITRRGIAPSLDIDAKIGYAFELDRWRYRLGFDYRLTGRPSFKLGLEYHDEVVHRPTIVAEPGASSHASALIARLDPFDYYLEKGFEVRGSFKPTSKISVKASFGNFRQSSLSKNTDYAFFKEDKPERENRPIRNGDMRSFSGEIVYDSRKLMKNKNKIEKINSATYTEIRVGVEAADPDLIDNDFDFTRYHIQIKRSQRTLGLGITKFFIYGGYTTGLTPPQRMFNVEHGGIFIPGNLEILTIGERIFSGTESLVLHLDHEFGDILFRRSRIPLIKEIPFSLSFIGTIFWTDLVDDYYPDDFGELNLARKGYAELGFGLRGILPLNLRADFMWKVSDHPTNKFGFGVSGMF